MADEDTFRSGGRRRRPRADVSRAGASAAGPRRRSQRERDDYYDRLLRKTAEFDNYRKRVERERREQADQAVVDLLLELLLVVDDFDRALTVDAGEGGGAYRKGVELIHAKLHDLLRKQGVRADRGARRRLRSEPASGGRARSRAPSIARAK